MNSRIQGEGAIIIYGFLRVYIGKCNEVHPLTNSINQGTLATSLMIKKLAIRNKMFWQR